MAHQGCHRGWHQSGEGQDPYGELKRGYDELHRRNPSPDLTKPAARVYRWIMRILRPAAHARLLDVGCGKGEFLRLAQQAELVTFGIDISDTAVEVAKRIAPRSEIYVGVGESLPWDNNWFDYVVCLGSLEHFLNPERAVREMARVLKRKGIACILLPNSYFLGLVLMAWVHALPPDHGGQDFSERFGTRIEWQKLLESAFEVSRVYKCNQPIETQKANRVFIQFYNFLLRPWLPLNLSDCFCFICRKRT
jgi:SAM-dependent methyltransferase